MKKNVKRLHYVFFTWYDITYSCTCKIIPAFDKVSVALFSVSAVAPKVDSFVEAKPTSKMIE